MFHSDLWLISTRMAVSTPKHKLKGVSSIAVHGVVLYDHKTFGNSSNNLPFSSSNLVFKAFKMVIFITSVAPFVYGYLTYVNHCLMPNSSQNSQNSLETNCLPLSEIRILGPNRQMMSS